MKFAIVVLTLDAGPLWREWVRGLLAQSVQPAEVLVLDSESTDGTANASRAAGFRTEIVERRNFDHGDTRQLALSYLAQNIDIVVYLTQDAILAESSSLATLMEAFGGADVGVAYGRQLPRMGAGAIEAHARFYNYPKHSQLRDYGTRLNLGLRAAFCSDSFAAYRRSALTAVGGFPRQTIFGEDMIVAAKLLKAGWKVAYVADAPVYHSHPYTIAQEFRRYFDAGVMHAREPWLLADFGPADGEGLRFVSSEISYLLEIAPTRIPEAMIKTAAKLLGYRLGRIERYISVPIKLRLSMNKAYWRREDLSIPRT